MTCSPGNSRSPRHSPWLFGAFLVGSVVLDAPSRAAPPAGAPKRSSAGRELRRVVSNFSKVKSYEVRLSFSGGRSERADHEVKGKRQEGKFSGKVYRNKIMFLPDLKVYRTPETAVFLSGEGEKRMPQPLGEIRSSATRRQATLMHAFFAFPHTLLSRAARHSNKAKWLKSEKRQKRTNRKRDAEEDTQLSTGPEKGKGEDRGKEEKPKRRRRRVQVEIPPAEVAKIYPALLKQMEGSGSRKDRQLANLTLTIEFDPKTNLPERLRATLLAARIRANGKTLVEDERIVGGEHTVVRFSYRLSRFGKARIDIPSAVLKALRKS